MTGKELRNLQESYFEMYNPERVDEEITSKKGKAKAAEMIAKRSTASGRAKPGQGSTVSQIKHISRSDKEGLGGTPPTRSTSGKNRPKSYSGTGGTGNKAARRAGLTPTREKPNAWEEQVDIYDVVLSHLLDEGYAETPEAAEAIMVNMSEEWIDSIVDEVLTEGEKPFPHEKVKAKQVALRDKGGNALDRRMRMGAARRRATEAEKTGGSQQDAGKGWYHGR